MSFIGKNKRLIKTIVFLIAAGLCLGICNYILKPVWMEWNNYNTIYGFYEEPDETIETVFLGKSYIMNGIIPIKLYEDYGICSYDLSTEEQPMMASYYLLEETYRLHSETLDTVVLEVSGLKYAVKDSYYHKALDGLKFSDVKVRAIRDFSDGWEETILNLFPLLTYHSRWDTLGSADILKAGFEPDVAFRGYHYSVNSELDKVESYDEINVPLYEIDENVEAKILDEEGLYYMDKITEFCEENDLHLILVKLPSEMKWNSHYYNAVQEVADSYNLEFMDFTINPYYDEIGYNFATDSTDNKHANYWGALKITDYMGQYLSETCGNRDVRGDASYEFMEEELEEFYRLTAAMDFSEFTDPCEYLSYALELGDYTIFLSVKNDAANKMTDAQREFFASVGLAQLSELPNNASYLAVLDNGEVLTECFEADSDAQEGSPLSYEGVLQNKTAYSVVSGGSSSGNISSVLIDGEEYSSNGSGLNIVVYDNLKGEVTDSASFNTHSSSEREQQNEEKRLKEKLDEGVSYAELSGTDRILYQYDRACENEKLLKNIQKEVGEDGLISYLEIFSGMGGMDIYLSVKGEAASCLTEEVRAALKEMGLVELSQIEDQDSYLALIRDGNVEFEERESKETPLEDRSAQAVLVSDGSDSGGISSVVIDGEERSMNERGINIVVYDSILETVVDSAVFDTFSVEPAV